MLFLPSALSDDFPDTKSLKCIEKLLLCKSVHFLVTHRMSSCVFFPSELYATLLIPIVYDGMVILKDMTMCLKWNENMYVLTLPQL